MKNKASFFAICIFVVISLVLWLTISFVERKLELSVENLSGAPQPDSFMHGVVYQQMSESGILADQLVAPEVVHYPSGDVYVFSTPELTVTDSAQQRWLVRANSGKSENSNTKVDLTGQVSIIKFIAVTGNKSLEIKTDNLIFYPEKKYFETAAALTILEPGNILQAVGAQLDLNTTQLKLLSKVEGEFQ